jgi:hypothetical protein
LVWFSYKMDLVIKIGFGLVSTLVMVNLIFCTPLLVPNHVYEAILSLIKKNYISILVKVHCYILYKLNNTI